MKIRIIKEPQVICSNRNSIHSYFAWPTAAKLADGTLAMVCSGFRLRHVCPFGKGVICYSRDNGQSWSAPAVIIDTPLDDRDCGIAVSGKKVIVTSFNNSVNFQREYNSPQRQNQSDLGTLSYVDEYLSTIDSDAEEKYLASEYVISNDGGYTFGEIQKLPVTCPHGPGVDNEGNFVYVGRAFNLQAKDMTSRTQAISCYISDEEGAFVKTADIPYAQEAGSCILCEPHTVVLPDGRIVVHLRADCYEKDNRVFTLYQTVSTDGGKTFSVPKRLLSPMGGAPSHLLLRSDGSLIATYGYRSEPYGIRAMISYDGGDTWDTDNIITEGLGSSDIGYPSTVELDDGSLLTVFYSRENNQKPAEILQVVWTIEGEEKNEKNI